MPDPIRCLYCGARIVRDPAIHTPTSAWSAPDHDDPTTCRTDAPGHAPDHGPPWESWFVPDNGMTPWRRGIVQAADLPRARREHETWTRVSRERADRHGLVSGRYELRPPGDRPNG